MSAESINSQVNKHFFFNGLSFFFLLSITFIYLELTFLSHFTISEGKTRWNQAPVSWKCFYPIENSAREWWNTCGEKSFCCSCRSWKGDCCLILLSFLYNLCNNCPCMENSNICTINFLFWFKLKPIYRNSLGAFWAWSYF